MAKIVQVNLDKLGRDYRQRIERRSEETGKPLDEVIVEMLSRKAWLDDFHEARQRLAPYAKDMTEEEILSLPRVPAKDS